MPHILVIIIIGAIAGWIARRIGELRQQQHTAGYRYRYCGWLYRHEAVWHQAGYYL